MKLAKFCLLVAAIVGAGGLDSCAQTQSRSSPPSATSVSIAGSFESSADHPWSTNVQVQDDRLVFNQATLVTARVGPFDSSARRTAEAAESWADHWAFGPHGYAVFFSETRQVIETVGSDLCGPSPVRFVVLTAGRKALTANSEEIRLHIAHFRGPPSAATECGSPDLYFATRRQQN